MIIQVDFYKETGKYYAGCRLECKPLPWEDGVLDTILKQQDAVTHPEDFHIVVSDIPESENDPNYRMTYSRLYSKPEEND